MTCLAFVTRQRKREKERERERERREREKGRGKEGEQSIQEKKKRDWKEEDTKKIEKIP